jgi:DNA-directed RNA polymerase specialized sigma24 family protein
MPTMRSSDLAQSAYLKLFGSGRLKAGEVKNREHFKHIMRKVMTCILLDHGRRSLARGAGAPRVRVEDVEVADPRGSGVALEDILTIRSGFAMLRSMPSPRIRSDRWADVIERKVAGEDFGEIAAELEVSEKTARRDFVKGVAWMRAFCGKGVTGPPEAARGKGPTT